MEKWVEDHFSDPIQAGAVAYFNVFNTIEVAREFRSKFLSHLPDVKLIGIELPEAYVGDFIEFENNPVIGSRFVPANFQEICF
ncbi:hypothetical protein [Gottfriedia acidiceleris]|uniref:hypothetical protein n=1 Tax=Gottfriedia acidiceleris TaxID=371036 RepID=UPI00101D2BF5|nr:hypothetical protein [Gottfriedia acidiceleris]